MLTQIVKDYIDRCVLCWLATCTPDGIPNVSPKEIFSYDESGYLIIAHIASPVSIINIKHNPAVCVSFVDIFVQKGYKISGKATIIDRSNPSFPQKSEKLKEMAGEMLRIAAVIEIDIKTIEEIKAPRYQLFPDTTEEQQVESAMKTYGVKRSTTS